MRRVVVTGMGGISPLGSSWAEVEAKLRAGKNAIAYMPTWEEVEGLRTRLAAPVQNFEIPSHYERKKIRSMGRGSLMATRASELALEDSGLKDSPELRSGSVGIAYGSSTSGIELLPLIGNLAAEKRVRGITATSWLQILSHICAANIGLFFELTGRIIPTSSACTSGSLGIGYAYEAIKQGSQTIMLAGGAEELSMTIAAMFDVMMVTSLANDKPHLTPRPFDKARDGLVVAEGACTFVLEEFSHAQARGAKIYAEVLGFGSNSDGSHLTTPSTKSMQRCMELALQDAGIPADAIGYVKAHATGTEVGDIAESQATQAVFGPRVAISSLKSYLGHTLGASGALEAWISIQMMNTNWYAPTLNLEILDSRCAELDYLQSSPRTMQQEYLMSNTFAFGGVNTSLIFRRWS